VGVVPGSVEESRCGVIADFRWSAKRPAAQERRIHQIVGSLCRRSR
jgi:hypothetical protein